MSGRTVRSILALLAGFAAAGCAERPAPTDLGARSGAEALTVNLTDLSRRAAFEGNLYWPQGGRSVQRQPYAASLGTLQNLTGKFGLPVPLGQGAAATDQVLAWWLGGAGAGGGTADAARVWWSARASNGQGLSSWTETRALPQARWQRPGAVAFHGRVYLAGGQTATGPSASVISAPLLHPDAQDGSLGEWRDEASMTLARTDLGALFYWDGNLYAAGGAGGGADTSGVVELAPVDPFGKPGPWSRTESFADAGSDRTAFAVASDGGFVFATGGDGAYGTDVRVSKIRPDGTLSPFRKVRSLPSARSGHRAAVAGQHLFLLGGAQSQGGILSAPVLATGDLGPWNATIDPSTDRAGNALVACGTNLLSVGGGPNSTSTPDGVVFDLALLPGAVEPGLTSLGSATSTGALDAAREGFALAVQGGYAYALGGTRDGQTAVGDVVRAPLGATLSFSGAGLPKLPAARTQAAAVASQFTDVPSAILVFGGFDGAGAPAATVYVSKFNSPTDVPGDWQALPPLPVAKGKARAALDNSVLCVVGGEGAAGPVADVACTQLVFNTYTAWQPSSSARALPAPRSRPAVAFAGGTLYVVGGDGGSGPTDTVFIGKVASADQSIAWSTSPAHLGKPRAGAEVVLSNGALWVLGGAGDADPAEVSNLNPDGTLTAFHATPDPAAGRKSFGAFADHERDRVVALGGLAGSPAAPLADAAAASVSAPSQRAAWSQLAPFVSGGLNAVTISWNQASDSDGTISLRSMGAGIAWDSQASRRFLPDNPWNLGGPTLPTQWVRLRLAFEDRYALPSSLDGASLFSRDDDPSKLVFAPALPAAVVERCSAGFAVSVRSAGDVPVQCGYSRGVSLGGAGLQFFADPNCAGPPLTATALGPFDVSTPPLYVKAHFPGTITATATTSVLAGASGQLVVSPGDPVALAFAAQPARTARSATLALVQVTLSDAQGNTATPSALPVTLSLAGNAPGSAHLYGTLTRAAVAGVASFDDLSIDTAAAGYQLRAAAGTLPQATSAIFDITGGGGTDGGPDGGGADGGVPDAGSARDQQIASERHGLIGFSCASGGGEWLAALGLAALLQLRRCRGQRRAGHPAAPPLLALLAALLVPAGVRAEDLAPLLGVLRLDDRQPPPVSGEAAPRADAAALEERLRALIARRHPEVRVMDRSTFVVLAAAKGRDLAQCEGECAVETGRLLGLDLVVTGALARFGSSLKLTLRLDRAGDDPRQLAVAQAGGADAAALEEALPAALDSLLLPLGGEVAALQASRLRDQPPPRLSLLALAVADPAGSSVGGEVLAAARLPLGEARLGGAIAAHPGLRAAWVFTPLSLGRLSLRLGPRLLLTPLPGETGLGFGAAAEVRYRAHVRLSLVGSLGVEVQRAQGESRTAALALLGAEVGLWL